MARPLSGPRWIRGVAVLPEPLSIELSEPRLPSGFSSDLPPFFRACLIAWSISLPTRCASFWSTCRSG